MWLGRGLQDLQYFWNGSDLDPTRSKCMRGSNSWYTVCRILTNSLGNTATNECFRRSSMSCRDEIAFPEFGLVVRNRVTDGLLITVPLERSYMFLLGTSLSVSLSIAPKGLSQLTKVSWENWKWVNEGIPASDRSKNLVDFLVQWNTTGGISMHCRLSCSSTKEFIKKENIMTHKEEDQVFSLKCNFLVWMQR